MDKYSMEWTEFNPVEQYGAALKLIRQNCIHHGGNYYVVLFLSTKTEIFAFIKYLLLLWL